MPKYNGVSIQIIAKESGFASRSSFHTHFKNIMKQTPAEWISKTKNAASAVWRRAFDISIFPVYSHSFGCVIVNCENESGAQYPNAVDYDEDSKLYYLVIYV